jgi:hypothetical protein
MKRIFHVQPLLLLLAALLALALVACGDDDGGRDSPFAPRSNDRAQSDDFFADDDCADFDDFARGDDSADDNGRRNRGPMGGGGGGSWSDSECFALGTSIAALFAATFGGIDATDALSRFDEIGDRVPSEMRVHFETVREAFGGYFDALIDAGWDPQDPQTMVSPAVQEAMAEAGERMESAEVEHALGEIEAYFNDVCPQFN